MKFKLDENIGTHIQCVFRAEGYDVTTVLDQGLQGYSDQHLYEICCAEKRCLVTLDMDFTDVTRFSPSKSSGIIVIRVPRNTSLDLLEKLVLQCLQALTQMPVEKKLWIVEVGRIRVHQSESEERL